MAIKLTPPSASSSSASAFKKSPLVKPQTEQAKSETVTPAKQATPSSANVPSHPKIRKGLMKGKQAHAILERERLHAESRASGQTFRFWLPKNGSASITFLDGSVSNGVLDLTSIFEHNIQMAGKWGNYFICTQEDEPCPICEGGGFASYVSLLTVIDHSEYVSKKDGQTKRDNVKLYAANKDVLAMLTTLAIKRGGLRGCRFDVVRTGEKAARVGNVYDFTEKLTDAQLFQLYKEKSAPIDYNAWYDKNYHSAADLRKLGFGSLTGPIGSEPALSDDYSDSL